MRALIFVAIVLALLAPVKTHLVRTDAGVRETRVVLQQPFAFPIDSADAFCLRRLGVPIYQCAMQFRGERDAGLLIARLPFCPRCADAARYLSKVGRDPAAVAQRERDFEAIADFAAPRP